MKQQRITFSIAILALLLLLSCGTNKITNNTVPPQTVTLTGSHCDVLRYDFNTDFDTLTNSITWSTDIGAIDTNGFWVYAPTLLDVGSTIPVTITATDTLDNKYTAIIKMNLTNEAPQFIFVDAPSIVQADKATEVYITIEDDCDPVFYSIVSGPATIDSTSGILIINAPASISQQTIVVKASDGNASSTYEIDILVQTGSLYKVEIPQIGDSDGPVFQGQHVEVPVNLTTGNIIDGFDFLIGYDNSALSFQSAAPGSDLITDDWEYFTYRYGANGNCDVNCPTGLLRLVAIAETNNGPNHPILDGVNELAVMDFLVTNDRTLECYEVPVSFFWIDCGDNTLSADGGNTLIVSEFVFDGDEDLFPPDGNEIQNFAYGFPTYFGTQDECIVPAGSKPAPVREASFNNGFVFIACADSIDLRGDINLNNVANEIADAVLYSNYFIYGIGALIVDTHRQIAASDVNDDGLSLTVADLSYLVRIIVGDALVSDSLIPVNATLTNNSGRLSVDKEMGAVLVVLEGDVTAVLQAPDMTMISNFDGTNTKVLVYSLEGNTFTGEFLHISSYIVSIEFGSAIGSTVIITP